jgi:hypothetical protein
MTSVSHSGVDVSQYGTDPCATTPLSEDILWRMRKKMRIPTTVTTQSSGGKPWGVGIGFGTGSMRIFGSGGKKSNVKAQG